MGFAFVRVVVLAPDKTVRPIRIVTEWLIVNDGSRRAMLFPIRIEPFRAFDVAVRNLQRQIRGWVPGNSPAIGIEAWSIEIVTIFIRLAPGENTAFQLGGAQLQPGV